MIDRESAVRGSSLTSTAEPEDDDDDDEDEYGNYDDDDNAARYLNIQLRGWGVLRGRRRRTFRVTGLGKRR